MNIKVERKQVVPATRSNHINTVPFVPPQVSCGVDGYDPEDDDSVRDKTWEIIRCLEEAWSPVLESSFDIDGLTPVNRVWVIREMTPETKTCFNNSERGQTSFYCGLNVREIVIRADQISTIETLVSVVSHEYGHHVQNMVGLESGKIKAASSAHLDRGGLGDSRIITKRYEAQAECFAGIGSRAVDREAVPHMLASNYDVKRKEDLDSPHPSGRNNMEWFRIGAHARSMEECNSWVAPESDVR